MLGEHLIVGLEGAEIKSEEARFLQKIKPIGLILFSCNFLQSNDYSKVLENQKQLLSDFSELTGREKFIVCIDHEGGRAHHLPRQFTHFPYARAWANHAKAVAEVHCKELSSLGVNFNLGPVADIDTNWQNPVIGPRAFANNSQAVIASALDYIKAFKSSGIQTCLKHFPGHGATIDDSHYALPVIDAGFEDLDQQELVPFKELIKQADSAVMLAHLMLKAVDEQFPSSISKKVIQNLLRKQIGFSGLTITDDICMHALAKNYSFKEIVKNYLEASGDLMIVGKDPKNFISEVDVEYNTDRIDHFLEKLSIPKVSELSENDFQTHGELLALVQAKQTNKIYQEPEPACEKLPKNEPIMRIGLVLEQDDRSQLSFEVPTEATVISGDGSQYEIEAKSKSTIKLENNRFELFGENLQVEFAGPAILKLNQELEFKTGNGIKVFDIPVGRNFHWEKTADEIFSGILRFTSSNGKLILINYVPYEQYVTSVVASEMHASELPKEFAKAQAIAARSWAYVCLNDKYPDCEYVLCNDDMSQRYRGSTEISNQLIDLIAETKGEYLVDSNQSILPAWYYKACGGHTESSKEAYRVNYDLSAVFDSEGDLNLNLREEEDFKQWVLSPPSGLFCQNKSKYLSTVDVETEHFRWKYILSMETLMQRLKDILNLDVSKILNIILGARGASGRLLDLKIEYLDNHDDKQTVELENQLIIRFCMHQSCLYSSAFFISEEEREGEYLQSITVKGSGWGHGVGFCQIGAAQMADLGKSYQEILEHYYPGSRILKADYSSS